MGNERGGKYWGEEEEVLRGECRGEEVGGECEVLEGGFEKGVGGSFG